MKGGVLAGGTGDNCGTMTSDITSSAAPTVPSATVTQPVAIPSYLRARSGAGSSPRSSPHNSSGSSPGGSSIGCSPRGAHRRTLHKKSNGGSGSTSHQGSPLTINNNNRISGVCENGNSRNAAGSTPQTTRKVYTLSNANTDRYSPNGSPRNTTRTSVAATTTPKRTKNDKDIVTRNNMINNEDSSNSESQSLQIQPEKKSRKSSKGNNDVSSGGGRRAPPRLAHPPRSKDNAVSIAPAGASAKGCGNVSVTPGSDPNINSTNSTVTESTELSQSAKLDELWKDRKIEQGMVRIPTNLLDDLIRKESIENFYIVEDTPVAR